MEEKSRKPEDTPFKQQKLKAWQPILTPNWVIGTFAIVGLIFIPLGVLLNHESDQVVEYVIPYDGLNMQDTTSPNVINVENSKGCYLSSIDEGNTFDVNERGCLITINIEKNMQAPIFVYYQLENFYQNHRRYVQSRSDAQLRGDPTATTKDCDPLQYDTLVKYNSTDKEPLVTPAEKWALNPCGLIANSLFNDIFWINSITPPNSETKYQNDIFNGKKVVNLMDQSGIAWKSDIETKFKNIPEEDRNAKTDIFLWENPKYRYIIPQYVGQPPIENMTAWTTEATSYGVQDEHFIVWMRTAGLPKFRKLYGRIEEDLQAGTKLEFLVSSNFVVSTFDGKKSLVISTTSWFGGRNPFLGIAYIIVGSLCMILAILFFAKHKFSPRKLGDTRYLVWKNNQ